jgi:hypothetical protein
VPGSLCWTNNLNIQDVLGARSRLSSPHLGLLSKQYCQADGLASIGSAEDSNCRRQDAGTPPPRRRPPPLISSSFHNDLAMTTRTMKRGLLSERIPVIRKRLPVTISPLCA